MKPAGRPARLLDGPTSAEPAFPRVGPPEPAESEADRAHRRGFDEGLAEGRRRAVEEATAEVEASRTRLAEAIAGLAAAAETFQRERERQILAVALAAASRIVRIRIDAGDPIGTRAAREAVDALPESAKIRIRLCPADHDAIATALHPEIARGRIVLVPDAALEHGGCVAESDAGSIDARISTAERAVHRAACPDEVSA